MKNISERVRIKPSPILVLDYGFDYKLQICGQICFGTETFLLMFQHFFFRNYFSVPHPPFEHILFWQMCEALYKTMNLANHSLL